jgi:hypothetical protein
MSTIEERGDTKNLTTALDMLKERMPRKLRRGATLVFRQRLKALFAIVNNVSHNVNISER